MLEELPRLEYAAHMRKGGKDKAQSDGGFDEVGGEGAEEDSCCICLEVYEEGEDLILLPCLHRFHYNCMRSWTKTSTFSGAASCPYCKTSICIQAE